MTFGDSMSGTHDCGEEAAAYALGALEPSQAEEYRRHLDSCVVCRDEVAAFRQVVDALPMAAPQQPAPRELRRRVIRDVRAEPRLMAGAVRRRLPPRLSGGFALRPALAGGLLAAALAIGAGLALLPGQSSGTRVIQAAVQGVPGSAQVRVAGGHAELIVSHLPPPPAGRIYELWIERGRGTPTPTGALFSVTASGAAEVGVPGDVHGVSTIMVTPELAGGSRVPTRAPVIVARLA